MYIKNVCILHVATVVKHTNGINHVFLLLHHMSIPFTFIYFRVHVGGVHTYMYRGKERSFAKKEQEQHTLHVVRRILFVNSEIIILLVTMHINLFIEVYFL